MKEGKKGVIETDENARLALSSVTFNDQSVSQPKKKDKHASVELVPVVVEVSLTR